MNDYQTFLNRKSQFGCDAGFDPVWMPDFLFDFQRHLVEWSLRKGRAAIFADCGLGKTLMQLAWAENVVRKTNGRVLIATPIAVGPQTVAEGERFGIEAERVRDGRLPKSARIAVTNYEQLHKYNASDFTGMVCDESSCIKDFKTQRKRSVVEFMRTLPYRLLCTATAAPNDYWELGTSSEALGLLGFRDIITAFFKQETSKDYLGWGRTKYRFRGHAEEPFWRWVCSWARSLQKPSDIGFSDEGFQLPRLNETSFVVEAKCRDGMLFTIPARDMREEREERRNSIKERCERAAAISEKTAGPMVIWCELNAEGDLLKRMIPGSVEVKGSMSDDEKETSLTGFSKGTIQRLITKPKIGAWGLNWQHCCNTAVFPSHSYEQYYQLVRRFYRFGQTNDVNVSLILCEGEQGVIQNLKRKQAQSIRMFANVVRCMNESMELSSRKDFDVSEELPSWMA